MNRIELYKQTEEVLYQSYFDNSLRHGDCTACAVGNICRRHAIYDRNYIWNLLFMTGSDTMRQEEYDLNGARYFDEALALVKKTGYTKKELMQIEWAFESAPRGISEEDYIFNGLVAVMEVLKDIHGIAEAGIERLAAVHASRIQTAQSC